MVPAWSGRGRTPTREQVVAGAPKAPPVARRATAVPVSLWSRQTMKEGRKGPIVAACVAGRGWPHHLTLGLLAHVLLVRRPCRRKNTPRA